jgi:hypothetical protein
MFFLELYLEEIADRIVEVDMECQTDAFLDRPPTPLFIPAKTGKDVATQILGGEVQCTPLLPSDLKNGIKIGSGRASQSKSHFTIRLGFLISFQILPIVVLSCSTKKCFQVQYFDYFYFLMKNKFVTHIFTHSILLTCLLHVYT